MANERIPNDPYRAGQPNPADAPYLYKPRSDYGDDELNSAARLDNETQMDPELAAGPATSGKIALFAVGIAVVLGAAFYGLNHSSVHQAGTSPAATTAQNAAPASPAAPPGMRNVTPGQPGTTVNSQPGMTTGAAPSTPTPRSMDPKAPPAPAPTGGTE